MGVAATVEQYLKAKQIQFTLLEHEYCEGSYNTARAAKIDDHCLAKGVLLRDEDFHYTLCILPSRNKILRHTLNEIFDRHMVLVDEEELAEIFKDCAEGAIPALGEAYGLDVIWDEELLGLAEVYIEAGDHRHLIRLKQPDFVQLMHNKLHEHFSADRARHSRLPKKYHRQEYEL
jgi:Ala-tRNA(Pro) deacylase